MLEHIVANVLKTFLNEFIELDASGGNIYDKVHVGAWNGDLVLEKVVLKKSIFSAMGLPISLSYGVVAKLDLRIPWATLGIDPVVVTIDSVYLLLEPKYEWDHNAYNKREQMTKQAKLGAAELFASRRLTKDGALNKYSDMAKKWLFESFLCKAVNNIQVTIRELHIRYEDHVSVDKSPFCFGFTLESLHIGSSSRQGGSGDSNNSSSNSSSSNSSSSSGSSVGGDSSSGVSGGSSSSSSSNGISGVSTEGTAAGCDDDSFGMSFDGADSFRKLIEISHLAVYWNPLHNGSIDVCTTSFRNQSRADVERLMSRTICKRYHQLLDRPKHHYILHPTNISMRLDISLDASLGGARGCARCHLSDISIVFEDSQYRLIALLCANMSNFMQLERFSGIRPSKGISECNKAAAEEKSLLARSWWRYAIQAEIEKLTNPYYQTCSTHSKQKRRIEDQLVYIELWKSKLIGRVPVKSRREPEGKALFCEMCALSRRRRAATRVRKAAAEAAGGLSSNYSNLADDASESHLSIPSSSGGGGGGGSDASTGRLSVEPVRAQSEGMAALLAQLEEKLSYEQIIYFRSLAENDLTYDDPKDSWMGAWVNWASGGRMDNSKILEALKSDPERVMRGTQFGSPQTRPDQGAAEFETRFVVLLSLQKGSVTIALSKPQSLDAGTYIPFLEVALDRVQTTAIIRGAGEETAVSLNVTLKSMAASEIVPSADSADLSVIGGWRRQCIAERRSGGFLMTTTPSPIGNPGTAGAAEMQSLLFSLTFEQAPTGKKILTANLEQLQVLLSTQAPWVSQLAAWSSLYPEELVSWQKDQMATINQLDNYTAKLAAKLEQMVQQSPSLWITATINAPVVVLSGKGTPLPPIAGGGDTEEMLLVLDLGQVRIRTDRLAKEDHFMGGRAGSTGFTSDATQNTNSMDVVGSMPRIRATSRMISSNLTAIAVNRNDGNTQILEGDEGDDGEDEGEEDDADDGEADDEPDDDECKAEEKGPRCRAGNSLDPRGDEERVLRELDDQGFYDVFDLQVSEIEVYLTLLGDWFDEEGARGRPKSACTTVSNASPKIGIVDKFDVAMKVYVSVVFYDATISSCQLEVALPEINVRLSQDKLLSLVRFAQSFTQISLAPEPLPVTLGASMLSLGNFASTTTNRSGSIIGNRSTGSFASIRLPHSSWDESDGRFSPAFIGRGGFGGCGEDGWSGGRVEEVEKGQAGGEQDEFFDASEAVAVGRGGSEPGVAAVGDAVAAGVDGADEAEADSVASDDSFQSVEAADPIYLLQSQLCDALQSTIRQREQAVSSLMSQVRIAETVLSGAHGAGAANSTTAEAAKLHQLAEELRAREAELRTIKSRYIEARMACDAFDSESAANFASPEPTSRTGGAYMSRRDLPLPFEAFQDDGGRADDDGNYGGQGMDPSNRGQLPYTKTAPITKQHGRQWLRAEISLASVVIEVRCPVLSKKAGRATPRGEMRRDPRYTTDPAQRSPSLRTALLTRADSAMRAVPLAGSAEADGDRVGDIHSPNRSPTRLQDRENGEEQDSREAGEVYSKEEAVVLRLEVGGIRASIKYEEDRRCMHALKVEIDLHSVDIEDVISTAALVVPPGSSSDSPRVYLVSTQPSIPCLIRTLSRISPQYASDTAPDPSAGPDLLRMRYVFGGSGVADGANTRHKVRLEFRFLEVNAVPGTIGTLARMCGEVAAAAKGGNANTVSPAAHDRVLGLVVEETKLSRVFPNIDVRCRGQGMSVSLCDQREWARGSGREVRERQCPVPLCTYSLWSWTVRGESRADSIFLDLKLKELAAHHHIDRAKLRSGKHGSGKHVQSLARTPQQPECRGDWEWGDFGRREGSSAWRERRETPGNAGRSAVSGPGATSCTSKRPLGVRAFSWDQESVRIAGRSFRGVAGGSVPCVALHVVCRREAPVDVSCQPVAYFSSTNIEARLVVAPLKVLLVPAFLSDMIRALQRAGQQLSSGSNNVNSAATTPKPAFPMPQQQSAVTAEARASIVKLFAAIYGHAEMVLGQMDVVLPLSYSTYDSDSADTYSASSSTHQDSPTAASYARPTEPSCALTFTMGAASVAAVLTKTNSELFPSYSPDYASPASLASLEIFTALSGATIRLGAGLLLAPVEVHGSARICPVSAEMSLGRRSGEEWHCVRSGLLGSYRNLPLHAPSAQSCVLVDIQSAVALGPLAVSLSEQRFAALGKWAMAWGAVALETGKDKRSSRPVAPTEPVSPAGPATLSPPLAALLPPTSAHATLMMQEISVALETNLVDQAGAGSGEGVQHKAVGVYLLSVRGVAASLALSAVGGQYQEGREKSGVSDAIDSATSYDAATLDVLEAAEGNAHPGDSLLAITAVCRSVDFDDCLGSLDRRLICTATTAAEGTPGAAKTPILTLSMQILPRSAAATMSIRGAQVYIVADAVVRLAVLVESYADALAGLGANVGAVTGAVHSRTGLLTLLDTALHAQTHKAAPTASCVRSNASFGPQPSSLPLSSADTAVRASPVQEANGSDSAADGPLRVFLTRQAFALPMAFEKCSLTASILGCGLWIPIVPPDAACAGADGLGGIPKPARGLGSPRSTSPRHTASSLATDAVSSKNLSARPLLHTGADISLSSNYGAVSWDRLLPSFANSEIPDTGAPHLPALEAVSILTTRVALTTVSVCLSRNAHPEVHQPLLPISQTETRPVGGLFAAASGRKLFFDQSTMCDDASAERVLLVPFSAELCHSVELARGGILRGPRFVADKPAALQDRPENVNGPKGTSEGDLQAPSEPLPLFAFRRLLVRQRLAVLVQEVQLLAFLDYRALLALADGLSPLATLGGTEQDINGSLQPPFAHVAPARNAVYPASLLELLPHLGSMSTLHTHISQEGISVHIINDLYRPPVCVARVLCGAVTGSVIGSINCDGASCTEFRPYPSPSTAGIIGTIVDAAPAPDTVKGLSCNVKTTAGIDYRNQTLTAWEPVLEPVEAQVSYRYSLPARSHVVAVWCLEDGLRHADEEEEEEEEKRGLGQDGVDAQAAPVSQPLAAAESSSPLAAAGAWGPTNELCVTVPNSLNVNLTMPLLETVHSAAAAVAGLTAMTSEVHTGADDAALKRGNREAGSKGREKGDVLMQNKTGLTLFYWAKNKDDESSARMQAPMELAPQCDAPLSFETNGRMGIGLYMSNSQRVGDVLLSSRIVRLAVCPVNAIVSGDALVATGSVVDADASSVSVDVSLEGRGCRIFTLACPESDADSSAAKAYSARSATIVTELYSRSGITSLLVRSTARIANQTCLPVKVMLWAGRSTGQSLRTRQRGKAVHSGAIFEALLAPGAYVSLPAAFCDLLDSRLTFFPVVPEAFADTPASAAGGRTKGNPALNDAGDALSAEIPIPELPGGLSSSKRDEEGAEASSEETGARALPRRNAVRHRMRLQQQRGAVDTLCYSHWLRFASAPAGTESFSFPSMPNLPADSSTHLNCNVHVVSKGAPRSYTSRKAMPSERGTSTQYLPPSSSGGTDTCMSRLITLAAPVTIQNLLATPIYVALISEALVEAWAHGMRGVIGGGCVNTGMGAMACSFTIDPSAAGGAGSDDESLLKTADIDEPARPPSRLNSPARGRDVRVVRHANKAAAMVGSIYLARLAPGESLSSLFFHSTESFGVALRMVEEDGGLEGRPTLDMSALGAGQGEEGALWSSAGLVATLCGKKCAPLEALVRYPNSSTLRIQVEVVDRSGGREVSFFVPYWIVSQSVLPLEFAHSYNRGTPGALLNGLDGLCADQEYRYKYEDRSSTAGTADSRRRAAMGADGRHGYGPSGAVANPVFSTAACPRPARGGGVLLGPEMAVRGLGDLLEGRGAQVGDPLGSRCVFSRPMGMGFLSRQALNCRRTTSGTDSASNSVDQNSGWEEERDDAPKYTLVQCGYSKTDRRTATMQVRVRGRMGPPLDPGSAAVPATDKDTWSTPFPLDALDTAEAEMSRMSEGGVGMDLGGYGTYVGTGEAHGSPESKQIFVFGVFSTLAHAPFSRTKVCVVVDRYLLINCLGGGAAGLAPTGSGRGSVLEVRQFGYEQELFTVRPGDSTSLCWRPRRDKVGTAEPKGRGTIQIRLARPGWVWSGRVSLSSGKTEVTLRMRNEQDNSIMFLFVQVVLHGPRVCVIFRSGSQFAPYRIENHTLDTLQVMQKFGKGAAAAGAAARGAPTLTLFPYHVASYAWDEPLQPPELRLQVLASDSASLSSGILGGMPGLGGPMSSSSPGGSNRRRAWRDIGVFGFERLRTWCFQGAGSSTHACASDALADLGYLIIRVVTSGGQRVLQIHDRRNLPGVCTAVRGGGGGGGGSCAGLQTPLLSPSASMQAFAGAQGLGSDAPPVLALKLCIESVGGACLVI